MTKSNLNSLLDDALREKRKQLLAADSTGLKNWRKKKGSKAVLYSYFLHFYSHQLAMLLSLLLRHEHSELDCFSHLYTREVQAEVN